MHRITIILLFYNCLKQGIIINQKTQSWMHICTGSQWCTHAQDHIGAHMHRITLMHTCTGSLWCTHAQDHIDAQNHILILHAGFATNDWARGCRCPWIWPAHSALSKASAAGAWKHYIKECISISSSWVWVEAMSTLTLCFWQSWCSTCVEILLLKCTLRRGSVASDADKLAKFITRTTYAYICMCECVCLRVSLCACVCVPMCFSPRQSRDRGKFTCKCALQVCL